ncbi:Cornichon [Dillenia turbinata]|uniref:Cornichon n=1 Tax=Dillenia turbinata TaxID=194707 RepID=A0AAN8YZ50_9MAGN
MEILPAYKFIPKYLRTAGFLGTQEQRIYITQPPVRREQQKKRTKGREPERRMEESMMNLLAWLLSFVLLVIVLGIVVFQYMCLMDLEFDYINAYDLAYRINQVVLPEFVAQAMLCSLHLIAGHWLLFLMSLPYLYYNVKLYTKRKHLIDVTEAFNQLNCKLKQKQCKIYYLIFLILVSIFWMIYNVTDEVTIKT